MRVEIATRVSQRLEVICKQLFELRRELNENCEAGEREWYCDQIYLAMKVIDNKVLECIYREHPHLTPPELNDTSESS